MNVTILTTLAAGALAGTVAALIPNKKLAIALLSLIPVAMLVWAHTELSNTARKLDALDSLLYFFGPLWPSLGALFGFATCKWVRRFIG